MPDGRGCREGKGLLGCRLVLEVVGVQADVDDAFGAADPFEDVSLESRGLGLDDGDDSAGRLVDVVDLESFEGRKCFERTAFGAGGERDDNGGVVHSVAFFTFR